MIANRIQDIEVAQVTSAHTFENFYSLKKNRIESEKIITQFCNYNLLIDQLLAYISLVQRKEKNIQIIDKAILSDWICREIQTIIFFPVFIESNYILTGRTDFFLYNQDILISVIIQAKGHNLFWFYRTEYTKEAK